MLACAGGGDPPTTADPPPGAPASLAVANGDGQSGFAGTTLAVAPSVTVRDAAGRAVAGATITFAVVSGGGSIAGATVTSSAQGVATAGAWTLGPDGEQVLEARHAALTPARFHATVSPAHVEAVIPPSGGSIEISTPGHPFRGLKLTVRAGSFPDPGTWRFDLAAGVPTPSLPQGFNVIGPALHVETDRGRAARLMTLRVPFQHVAGSIRLFVVADPGTSALELAPIVAQDNESITVMIGHLNGSLLLSPGGPFASPHASVAGGFLVGYNVLGTMNALGITEALSGYLNKAWPAPEMGSYRFPAGHGPAIALLNLMALYQNAAFGGVVTVNPALGILADTASFASLQVIADRHARSVLAQQSIADLSAALAGLAGPLRDSLSAINLMGGLAIAKRPQLMVFEERFAATPGRRVFATVFGKASGALSYSSPTAPASQSTLTLGPGGFLAHLVREIGDAAPFDAEGILPLGGGLIYPVSDYLDVVPTMMAALTAQGSARDEANRSLATAAGFPNVTLEVQNSETGPWASADVPIVIRDSSAALRALCSDCAQALPQNGSSTRQTVAIQKQASAGFSGAIFPLGPASTGILFDALGFGDLRGAVLTLMPPALSLSALGAAYRPAVPIRHPLRLDLFHLLPDAHRVAIDSTVQLRTRLELPPPGGYSIDWDFGDGSPVVRTTDAAVVSHRYTSAGTRFVVAALRSGSSSMTPDRLLATARGTVVVDPPPKEAWRMTSLTKVAEVGNVDPDNPGAFWGGGSDGLIYGGLYTSHRNVMLPLLTAPAEGVLYRYTRADGTAAVGVQRVAVGAAPNLQFQSHVVLASTCSFAGCGAWYNLTITGDHTSGTITGFSVLSTISAIKGADGVTLTGTFRVAEGGVPVVDGQPELRPLHYVDYSFTAVRVP